MHGMPYMDYAILIPRSIFFATRKAFRLLFSDETGEYRG